MVAEKKENKLEIYTIDSGHATKDTPVKKFWHIDKDTWRFKFHFFMFAGALGTAMPYMAVFAKVRVGMSASSLAAVLTTQQFLCIFTKPLIGYISDYFNKLKVIICILCIFQGIFCFLLLTIPKINSETTENQGAIQLELYKPNSSELSGSCKLQPGDHAEKESMNANYTQWSDFCFLLNGATFPIACVGTDVYNRDPLIRSSLAQRLGTIRNQSNKSPHGQQISSAFVTMCDYCCNHTEDCYITSCIEASPHKMVAKSDFQAYPFWLFALFYIVAVVCINALFTLSDTACYESIQKTGGDFGRLRVWGAVGWGLMAPIGGFLNDYTDGYLASWIVMATMSLLSLWNILKLDIVSPSFSQNILKDIGVVLKSKEFLFFEMGVLMNGMFVGIIWFYLIWFLTTIGGSRFLCGMSQLLQCVIGAIPFMFFSGLVIKKCGHFNVLSMSLMAYCIRFFWYSQLHNPWLVLPIEIMHGFTYGFYYPTVGSFAKMSSKPGTEATTQSILFTTHEGLGGGIGCVLAGLGFDYLGGHMTFLISGVVAGCGTLLNIVLTLIIRRRQGNLSVTTPVNDM